MEQHQESTKGAAEAADLQGEAVAPAAESISEESVPEEVTAEETIGDDAEEVQEAEAAPSPAAIIEQLEAELAAAREEAAANLEQMKRVAAEFQNSKRRQEKQLADAIDRAGAQFVQSALPILDDFDLAFQNVPEGLDAEDAAWLDGFRQIQRKLADLLAAQGVELIPLEGEFDPNRHEAISSEPSEEVESGHIIETLRAGYTHKDRVLRPALVRVAM